MTTVGHVLLLLAFGGWWPQPVEEAIIPASRTADTTEASPELPTRTGFGAALRASEFGLSLNYRLEWVEETDPTGPTPKQALASTLRTAVSLSTGEWRRLSARIVAEDVTAIGNDLYDNRGAGSLANGRTDRSVIADPENTELAEAYLKVRIGEHGGLRLGRQELDLDQQRFVGAVGWRQNHQEFDAATLDLAVTEGWRLRTGYLDRVHTVTGAQLEIDAPYLEATGRLGALTLVGHGLWLDDRDQRLSGSSRATIGLRAQSSMQIGTSTWAFGGAYARQSEHADQSADFQLDYFQVSAAYDRTQWSATVGAELLEGDGTRAFQTPLATLHKFNGFADRFLVTPNDGLRDVFAGVRWVRGATSISLTVHDFRADVGSTSYGDEVDLVASWKSRWSQTFALKASHFEGDDVTRNTTKVWVWTAWSL